LTGVSRRESPYRRALTWVGPSASLWDGIGFAGFTPSSGGPGAPSSVVEAPALLHARKAVYEISVALHFSAAHYLPEYDGDCRSIHGHNWSVKATAYAETVDSTGLALDFRVLKAALAGILETLDHKNLNDVAEFGSMSPTAENISRWIFENLARKIDRPGVRLGKVAVGESPGYEAVYREA